MTARSSCWLRCNPRTSRSTSCDAFDGIRPKGLGQVAGEHVEGGQFLAHAVVQVLTDASLLKRCDLDDLALQLLSPADIARAGR